MTELGKHKCDRSGEVAFNRCRQFEMDGCHFRTAIIDVRQDGGGCGDGKSNADFTDGRLVKICCHERPRDSQSSELGNGAVRNESNVVRADSAYHIRGRENIEGLECWTLL